LEKNNAQIDSGIAPQAIFDALVETPVLYVANTGSDTVSVISTQNDTWIKDIPVGDSPVNIDINPSLEAVYVANRESNTVSVL
jgi:YVTN family beta-propeller protein